MTELVSLSTDITEARRQIGALRARVVSCASGDEALNAAAGIKVALHWAKLHKDAAAIRSDLVEVECLALRMVGKYHAESRLPAYARRAASGFAALSESDFAEIVKQFRNSSTAVSIWRRWREDVDRQADRARGRALFAGDFIDGVPADEYARQIEMSAREFLSKLAPEDRGFSVAEMSEALTDYIDVPEYLEDNQFIREGFQEVMRKALRESSLHDGAVGNYPEFVTFLDPEAGWVRIPFAYATTTQLRQMGEFRAEQARQIATKARELLALADRLQAVQKPNGHRASLGSLLRRLNQARSAAA